MDNFFSKKDAYRMGRLVMFFSILAVLLLGMKFVNEVKRVGAGGTDLTKISTIDVSGDGHAFAVPDVANESFTVEQKAATVHDAQAVVTKKTNEAIAFLKKSGIAEKDIQTTNYSAYPEYSNTNCYTKLCPTYTDGAQKIIGYTVSDTITVKIRDTEMTGKIVDGLGALGVTGLSGPNFAVDNPDAVNAQARANAINDAKEKAEVLATQLGVRLVRIVRFSENGGGYPMMAYDMKSESAVGAAAPMPAMPVGQNKYTSSVTLTNEIQ